MIPHIRLAPNPDGTYDILVEYTRADVELAADFDVEQNLKSDSKNLLKQIRSYAGKLKIKSVKISVDHPNPRRALGHRPLNQHHTERGSRTFIIAQTPSGVFGRRWPPRNPSVVVNKSPNRYNPRSVRVAVESQLTGAEAAGRFNGVALGFQFQFEALLTGDAGALLPRHDLAVAALAGNNHHRLPLAVFHRLIKPRTIQQIILRDFAGCRHRKIPDNAQGTPAGTQKITGGFAEVERDIDSAFDNTHT